MGELSVEIPQAPSTPRCRGYTRVGELTVGLLANWVISYGFDYVLYPAVIWRLGLIYGGIVMALLSFVACLLTVWFYDWSKRDWLGIEAIKSVREYRGNNRFRRIIGKVLCMGNVPAAVLLSVWYDPFITMVYLRKGQYSKMRRWDWGIFLFSWLLCNTYWALACFGGIELARFVWPWMKALVAG